MKTHEAYQEMTRIRKTADRRGYVYTELEAKRMNKLLGIIKKRGLLWIK